MAHATHATTTRVTKAQLQSEVERLRAHCDYLETQLAAVREELAAATAAAQRAAAQPASKPYSRVVPQRAPRELPAHFIAARELAMRTGRVVRVGA